MKGWQEGETTDQLVPTPCYPLLAPYAAITATLQNLQAESNHYHLTNFLEVKLKCVLKSLQITNLQSQPFAILKYQFPSRGVFDTSQTFSLLQPFLTSCQVKLLLLFPLTRVSWSSGKNFSLLLQTLYLFSLSWFLFLSKLTLLLLWILSPRGLDPSLGVLFC